MSSLISTVGKIIVAIRRRCLWTKQKVTRIKLRRFIRMGDGETREKLEEQKREMISSAKRMFPRSQVDFEQVDEILGFKSRVASYLNGSPWWMKMGVQMVLHVLSHLGVQMDV
jgi:hypothetical protein